MTISMATSAPEPGTSAQTSADVGIGRQAFVVLLERLGGLVGDRIKGSRILEVTHMNSTARSICAILGNISSTSLLLGLWACAGSGNTGNHDDTAVAGQSGGDTGGTNGLQSSIGRSGGASASTGGATANMGQGGTAMGGSSAAPSSGGASGGATASTAGATAIKGQGGSATGGTGGTRASIGGAPTATGGTHTTEVGTVAGVGGATPGTYVLPPDRATTWNLAGMLTKGGIVSASWPICNSTPLTPSGGTDDSAQINSAIASCPKGSIVQLGAGTFVMGQGHNVSLDHGVVLRGAAAGLTILKNPLNGPATDANFSAPDTTPIVIMGPGRWVNPDGDSRCQGLTAYQTAYMQLLTQDAAKGTTSVTVGNASIFKAGQFVLLDETSNASWQPDVSGISTSIWATADYAVQWNLHNPAAGDDLDFASVTPSAANNFSGIGNGQDAACWFGRQDRPQNEIKEIASVSGNTVTFTSPLHKSYRTANHAELTTYTGSNAHLTYVGIENLSIVGRGDGCLNINNVAYGWAKNIEASGCYGDAVGFSNDFRVELRDSYIHDEAWPEPGGGGYAISISGASSELLLENNISIRANKVMVGRSSGSGSVVAYNYMDDGYIHTDESWIEIGLNASHMVGSHHILFEGNQSFNMDSDDTHGNATYITYFRNWATTLRAKFTAAITGDTVDDVNAQSGPKRAAGAMRYSIDMSYVGNVLGMPGVTTAANGYVDECDTLLNGSNTIWMLGWNDVQPYTVDPNVTATAIRDGNWDWFLEQQTWLTGAAATLPDSLYLSSKPAFFGANTWPWVDPSTGTVHTLPAKARLDAGTPNSVP